MHILNKLLKSTGLGFEQSFNGKQDLYLNTDGLDKFIIVFKIVKKERKSVWLIRLNKMPNSLTMIKFAFSWIIYKQCYAFFSYKATYF